MQVKIPHAGTLTKAPNVCSGVRLPGLRSAGFDWARRPKLGPSWQSNGSSRGEMVEHYAYCIVLAERSDLILDLFITCLRQVGKVLCLKQVDKVD
jgi:hypothetical protein